MAKEKTKRKSSEKVIGTALPRTYLRKKEGVRVVPPNERKTATPSGVPGKTERENLGGGAAKS